MTIREGEESSVAESTQSSSSFLRAVREILIVLVTAIVLSVVVRTFFVQAFYVPSQSMENTLEPSDRILASKITTDLSGVKRGEIVVFRDPGNWLPQFPATPLNPARKALEFIGIVPTNKGEDLVKRVIGVEGDRIVCCDVSGSIVLNGVPLEEPYVKPGVSTNQVPFDITVPADSVFVMGDNRSESADSRYHLDENSGAVPVDNVVGRVFLNVWPLDRVSIFRIPEVPFADPALTGASSEG
jgi:signal peptidase I